MSETPKIGLTHLVIVLPCHSLEDFPTHYTGEDAANLLSLWSSLWHPALLHHAQRIPQWHSVDDPAPSWQDPLEGFADETAKPRSSRPLVVIPNVSDPFVDTDLLMQADQDGLLVSMPKRREDVIRSVIENEPDADQIVQRIDPTLVNDFYALAYAYLQVQLMTRQLRYSSNLNEHEFEQAILQAAEAAIDSNENDAQKQEAEERLTACFDILLEEKNAYYPVEPQLCDVVLTTKSTLGEKLTNDLQLDCPVNLLITGQVANEMEHRFPDQALTIREKLNTKEACLIGGYQQELADWMMPGDAILENLLMGNETLERVFGQRSRVFLRRSFGLSPSLPNLLAQSGYIGAIHATLGAGTFPKSANGVIRWAGDDDESVLCLADLPVKATEPGNFLGLGVRLGEMIDSAHMASMVFVRWPGGTCEALEDLRRICRHSPLFGAFLGLDEFFDSVYDPGYSESFAADEYRSPYLSQAIQQEQTNPISTQISFQQLWTRLEFASRFLAMADQCDPAILDDIRKTRQRLIEHVAEFSDLVAKELRDETDRLYGLALSNFGFESKNNTSVGNDAAHLVNPTSAKHRVFVHQLSDESQLTGSLVKQPPIALAYRSGQTTSWVADVNGTGRVHVGAIELDPKNHFHRAPRVAESGDGWRLQNEFFIVHLDPSTGGIRSVNFHHARINLLTQQLAMRIPSPKSTNNANRQPAKYTKMVADSIEILDSSPLHGVIRSSGKLLIDNDSVCDFQQTLKVVRGIPRVEIEVQLSPKTQWQSNSNHYLCSRLAWKDEGARLMFNAIDSRQPVASEWFHATQFVTVGDENTFTLLTGGLPFHRRSNRRMLDSLLMLKGETETTFRFALDINQAFGSTAAEGRSIDTTLLFASESENGANDEDAASRKRNWLLHLDSKNLKVTHCHPFVDEGRRGLQIRIRETEGRTANAKLRCARGVEAAEKIDFLGNLIQSLDVDEGCVAVSMGRFAFQQFNLYFPS